VASADGTRSDWLEPHQLTSSGLDERAVLARAMVSSAAEVRQACAALPKRTRDALAELRHRVAHDELPLLSLLSTEPLRVQSSHLSFQEYFAARAISEEGTHTKLWGAPPWQWPVWWANSVSIGMEMGGAFGRGLRHAASVDGHVDLSAKLGGDRPTVLKVVMELAAVRSNLNLIRNGLSTDEASELVSVFRQHDAFCVFKPGQKEADLSGSVGARLSTADCMLIAADLCSVYAELTSLDLSNNRLDAEAGNAISQALLINVSLKTLSLRGNDLGLKGAKSLAIALWRNFFLTSLDLSHNALLPESGGALAEALMENTAMRSINLDGVFLPVNQLKGTKRVETLDFSSKGLGPLSAIIVARLIESNRALVHLDIQANCIGLDGVTAIANALVPGTAVLNSLASLNLRNCNLSEAAKLTLNKAIEQRRASDASEIKVLV